MVQHINHYIWSLKSLFLFNFSNNINDIQQVEFLSLCGSLKNLTLEGNSICVTPNPEQTAVSMY